MREELEQRIIDACIHIDYENKKTWLTIPWAQSPQKLIELWQQRKASHPDDPSTNRPQALRALQKLLKKDSTQREMATKFWNELKGKGFLRKVEDLPQATQDKLASAPISHYFPYNIVFNAHSKSTPCRIVVDPLMSGLNELLAKGVNTLNPLLQVHIAVMSTPEAFSIDIKKMYNCLFMIDDDYCYHRVLWCPDLDKANEVEEWIIITNMYGVVFAGNASETAIRMAALHAEGKELAKKAIVDQMYMDDLLGLAMSKALAKMIAAEVVIICDSAGFPVKCITYSGEAPHEAATTDGIHTGFAGYKWASKNDWIYLGAGQMNFNPAFRGMKAPMAHKITTPSDLDEKVLPKNWTKQLVLSQMMQMWDICGRIEPLKLEWKLKFQAIEKYEWRQTIPLEHGEMIMKMMGQMIEVREEHWPRTFIPSNAAYPLDINLVYCSDGGERAAGAGSWARVRLTDGNYYCQMVFGRSELVRHTVPRNELVGATIAVNVINTVVAALKGVVNKIYGAVDSTIVMWWLYKHDIAHKRFTYGRIQHIVHYTPPDTKVYHVPGILNPSDKVSKEGQEVADCAEGSMWFNGAPWMKLPEEQMLASLTDYQTLAARFTPQEVQDLREKSKPEEYAQLLSKPGYEEEEPVASAINFNYTEYGKKHASKRKPKDTVHMVDVVRRGWESSVRLTSYVYKFINKIRHNIHTNPRNQSVNQSVKDHAAAACAICNVTKIEGDTILTEMYENVKNIKQLDPNFVEVSEVKLTVPVLTEAELAQGLGYWLREATKEVKNSVPKAKIDEYNEVNGILYYGGRVPIKMQAEENDLPFKVFYDGHTRNFLSPVMAQNSPITYAVAMFFHWTVAPHRGADSTARICLEHYHIIGAPRLFNIIRRDCRKCRALNKRFIRLEIGKVNARRWSLAPPFYSSMMDIMGPFLSYNQYNKRQSSKIWVLVVVCCTTSAVSLKVLERYDTAAVLFGMLRHSCNHGWGKYLLIDPGSQLVKATKCEINIRDLHNNLSRTAGMIVDKSPAGGHHHRGIVERAIGKTKAALLAIQELEKMQSNMEWETTMQVVANAINCLPIARCSSTDRSVDRHKMAEFDLISPARLLLGRNNYRAPEGTIIISNMPDAILEKNQEITRQCLTIIYNNAHRFIPKPKWHKGTEEIKKDDIVLFIKTESPTGQKVDHDWHIGRVVHVKTPYRVTVEYTNADSTRKNKEFTEKSSRQLIVIHSIEDLEPNTVDYQVALEAQLKYQGALDSTKSLLENAAIKSLE